LRPSVRFGGAECPCGFAAKRVKPDRLTPEASGDDGVTVARRDFALRSCATLLSLCPFGAGSSPMFECVLLAVAIGDPLTVGAWVGLGLVILSVVLLSIYLPDAL
jgi:hypothetical protein